ncbi:hypothetical protein [Alloprevotella tannerae]|uniref:hypothetical protein n=1 Tax=Alloprevotella tannerae TaxID=76122 RepID=UPI0028F0B304|nr:hypothetical protein [Alloprevotella tannerae]
MLFWAAGCLDVFLYMSPVKRRAPIAVCDGYAAPAAHRIAPSFALFFYRICRTCALPREHYFASSQRSLMVCRRQTMVCREQTIVWWEQTMVCRRQTKIILYAVCGAVVAWLAQVGIVIPIA